jgi:hypothetical protein
MGRPRLSILGLIAGVVACGVAFAALRSGSDYWLSAFYTMTVALLLGAVVAARYRRGISRSFWFGFAVFGWGGFLLTSNPWLPAGYSGGGGFGGDLNRNLLTIKVIQFLVVRIRKGTDDLDQIDQITANTVGIVSLLLVIAVAIAGGLFAVAMKKRARKIAVVDPSPRSNAVPSLVILVGLSFAGLGAFDRPAPANLSNALWEAGEPSLSLLAQTDRSATVYRFLWFPSFHHPITVRVTRTGNGARLEAIVLDGRGGYEEGQVAISRTIELSEGQWKGLERHLEAIAFWESPTRIREETSTDGDYCTIEGVKDGHYHDVGRRDPDPAFTALCRYMLDLTGLKVREVWEGYHETEPNPEAQR